METFWSLVIHLANSMLSAAGVRDESQHSDPYDPLSKQDI